MPATKNILCFGGGVDSTAILIAHLKREETSRFLGISLEQLNKALPEFDCVIFADTGAETPHTYKNVDMARALIGASRFVVAKNATHTLPSWLEKNGNVPLLPGGKHVCSLKFKGQVMERAARERFGADQRVTWSIGIEANEGARCKRFTAPEGGKYEYRYPLIELGINREKAKALIEHIGWPVHVGKSSCFFCPFMSEQEILDLQVRYPALWEECRKIEARFKAASTAKHQAWLKAGKPVIKLKNGGERARAGHWQKDSFRGGARLFAKAIRGRRLTIEEWTQRLAPLAQTQRTKLMEGAGTC